MKVALDTNVLVYVEGVNGGARQSDAVRLLGQLPEDTAVIPVQALGELYNVLIRKAGWPPDRARHAILAWRDAFISVPTSEAALITAVDLATDHRLGIWDSVMVSVAADAGRRLLLSEDLQDGFSWRGVTIVNPFADTRHPLFEALLSNGGGTL